MTVKMPLAIRLLRKVRGKPKRSSAMWGAQNAWAYLKRRDWSAAVYFAKTAIAFDPTWPDGYRMLGLAYRGQERFEDGRAAFQAALDAGVGDFQLLMDFGDLERSARQFGAAEGMYRQALALQPDTTEAMWKLGRALEGQARLEEATEVLLRARVLDSDDIEIARALSHVLTESGADAGALPLLEEVNLREPDYAFGHYYQGVVLARMGKRAEAVLHATRAVELDPANARYQQLVQSLQPRDS